MLQEIRHAGVVKLYGTYKEKNRHGRVTSTCLVMEACHGDLSKLINNRVLTEAEISCLARKILEPLRYLHTLGVINDIQKSVIIHRCRQ